MAVYRQGIPLLKNLICQASLASRTETRNIKRWVSPTLKELKRRKEKLGPQPEIPRNAFLEWNHQAEIYAFGKRLNEEFDKNVLQTALTNRSYVIQEENRQRDAGMENQNINIEDNKKLVQEGEVFINDFVKDQLKISFPKFPTEGINSIASEITSQQSLAHVAMLIGLKDLIFCSEYPPDQSTLSSTFKAVVAALIKSSGELKASEFVQDFVIMRQLSGRDINEIWHIEEPLKLLQTLLKAEVEPRLCNHSAGNTILAAYQVGLYVEKRCVGIGWGESTDIATEMAARDGLKRIFGTKELVPVLRVKAFDANEDLNRRTVVHN